MSQAPPQATEAEEAVLSAILLNRNALLAVSDEIQPDDFFRTSHAIIYKTALALDERGEPVDPITVVAELERRGEITKAGGRERIHELAALVGATSNAAHHARLIHETAVQRRLITAGGQIAQLGWNGNGDVDALLASAEKHLSEVTSSAGRRDFTKADVELDLLLADIDQAVQTGKPRMGLTTGFVDLDRVTTGLHPGQLVLVAARPAMGKSLLAQNVAEHVADHGGHAAIFSLEMSRREVQIRALSRAAGIDSQAIRTGQLTADELRRLHVAASQIRNRNLYVEDETSVTAAELRGRSRRLQRQHGLDLLVVDYIQLMLAGRGGEENRQQEIAAISRTLKMLARELDIPVVAISQLNREVEYRANKRPVLSDLRESGALEQDADLVLFLYRDDYYNPDSEDQGIAEVIVAKNRMGPSDTVRLAYVAKKSVFRNLARGV